MVKNNKSINPNKETTIVVTQSTLKKIHLSKNKYMFKNKIPRMNMDEYLNVVLERLETNEN